MTLSSVTGTFSQSQVVYQGSVGSETSTGKVVSWNSGTNILEVILLTGTFTYAVISIDNSNYGTITHINGVAEE